ncbi:putative chitosanase [Emericellopsis atlantica]|uniref:Endo-chitosanase n=1 Tax=Emericellopsis atlantica TaxID=2614577 RepID=A0A9P7ZIA3_9HYPO|nr:putative chitosanase [Emericellopsis atlantica]KAG9252431.1 putative chitosanase [Emericellopsis atlantica]
MAKFQAFSIFGLLATVSARDVPDNVRNLYDSIVNQGQGECQYELQGGFLSADDGEYSYGYCGDHLDSSGIIYLQGKGGNLANMDIDCDGIANGAGDDGRCGNSEDTQYQTAFQYTVSSYSNGVSDLNAYVHDYIVFGNYGSADGYTTFDPQEYGVKPLSIGAVVCGDKLVYGVWGDTNGDDGNPLVGEASISLATRCFGTDVNGNSGYDGQDVLYIFFTGDDAVPGEQADWQADSSDAFQDSLQTIGDRLIANL